MSLDGIGQNLALSLQPWFADQKQLLRSILALRKFLRVYSVISAKIYYFTVFGLLLFFKIYWNTLKTQHLI